MYLIEEKTRIKTIEINCSYISQNFNFTAVILLSEKAVCIPVQLYNIVGYIIISFVYAFPSNHKQLNTGRDKFDRKFFEQNSFDLIGLK